MDSRRSVEYLLVAEFDIDKGPTISHQYPEPLASDVKQLAELMLPDQSHVRAEDWTTFFLHFTPDAEGRTGDEMLEPPLMYVLSLVNTKHDDRVKRGAQVKALAVVTRHPFLQIFKPILLLALDEYFKNPYERTLSALYQSLNEMNLSGIPKLSRLERLVLMQSDRHDLFIERFPVNQRERAISTSSDNSAYASTADTLSYEPTTSNTTLSPTGTIITISSMPARLDTHFYTTTIRYNGFNIPVKAPTTSLPEIVGDFSVISLINTFRHAPSPAYSGFNYLSTSGPSTHQTIVLLNALLAQKRIVVLGRSQPSGTVASYVLAACAMASGGTGLLRSFTERAFPYTDLSKIEDLLTVDGFIAGVTNSVFELHPEWWDVMANIDTGQVIISSELKLDSHSVPTINTGEFSYDAQFIDDVTSSIADRASETSIRLKFRDFLSRFIHLSAVHEISKCGVSQLSPSNLSVPGHGPVFADEAHRKLELAQHAARIESWIGTESYICAVSDQRAHYSKHSTRVKSIDLGHQVDRLRLQKLSAMESHAIFVTLNHEIRTESHITELLSLAPLSSGGLGFLSIGLFHPHEDARLAACELLERVRGHSVGKFFYPPLSRFARMAHKRLAERMGSG